MTSPVTVATQDLGRHVVTGLARHPTRSFGSGRAITSA
jgi:hypothetical protein